MLGLALCLSGILGGTEAAVPEKLVGLLGSGKAIFGVFTDKSQESARTLSADDEVDLENPPFDVDGLKLFRKALGARAVLARLPPIRDGREEARARTKLLLDAGAEGVVFPHVENRDESEHAVMSMRGAGHGGTWAPKTAGDVLSFLLIEDKVGVENARDIVSAAGVSIVSPGPGDLRRAYDGDMAAVESAIQTVLAACKEFGVPCGITAGPQDVEKRLNEGFRVIIATSREAIPIGRRAAGR
jgi:2-keto-3-deoxy-L-rhamnonate aldolase RhmA